MRSRLDGWREADMVPTGTQSEAVESEPVWFRVFQGKQNWDRGTLVRRLGAVMAEVRDKEGNLHRRHRHQSQIRRAIPENEQADMYPVTTEQLRASPAGAPAPAPTAAEVQPAAPSITAS
ncbi:unnamed protein product, partial [Ilex paraguariensis]